jgi:hypothetical protein
MVNLIVNNREYQIKHLLRHTDTIAPFFLNLLTPI